MFEVVAYGVASILLIGVSSLFLVLQVTTLIERGRNK